MTVLGRSAGTVRIRGAEDIDRGQQEPLHGPGVGRRVRLQRMYHPDRDGIFIDVVRGGTESDPAWRVRPTPPSVRVSWAEPFRMDNLFIGIGPSPRGKGSEYPRYPAPDGPKMPLGQLDRVATSPWNPWQPSSGMGGSLGVEYAFCAGPYYKFTAQLAII